MVDNFSDPNLYYYAAICLLKDKKAFLAMSDLLMGLITNGAMSKAKIVALCKGAMVCGEIAARE